MRRRLSDDNLAAYDRMWSKELPIAGSYRFKKAQAEEAVGRLKRMRREAELWQDATDDLTDGAPKPLPVLRIIPTF